VVFQLLYQWLLLHIKIMIASKIVVSSDFLANVDMQQRFPNCATRTTSGARRPLRCYVNRPTTFCLSSQKCIHSDVFYLSGSVN